MEFHLLLEDLDKFETRLREVSPRHVGRGRRLTHDSLTVTSLTASAASTSITTTAIPTNSVLASMKNTHFIFNGADCTFHRFRMGSGLTVTVFLLFSAVVTWVLAEAKSRIEDDQRKGQKGRKGEGPQVLSEVLRPVAWGLFVACLGTMVLSWLYFFVGPGVFSTVIAGLLGWEAWRTFGPGRFMEGHGQGEIFDCW
jgi:hypothetical protein